MAVTINASTTAGLVQTADTSGVLALQTAGTTAVTVDASQNVGIGTASPTAKLNIVDASATVNVQLESGSVVGQYFASTPAGGVYVGSSSAHPLVFRTNTTERMRVDSSGNVGIGTSSVTGFGNTNLQINSSGDTMIHMTNTTSGTASGDGFDILMSGVNAQLINREAGYISAYTSATERMRIDSTGNVGIGTTAPANKLQVVGNDLFLTTASGNTSFGTTTTASSATVSGGFQALQAQSLRVGTFGGSGAYNMEFVSQNNVRISMEPAGSFFPQVDNSITIGKSGQRWSAVWAANGTIQTSDINAKTDVVDSPLGLNFITSLRPVAYKYKVGRNQVIDNPEDTDNPTIVPIAGKRQHFGLIAQEVKEALPVGVDFGGWAITDLEDLNSEQGLRYDQFIAPMIKAIQEQQALITQLQADVAALKGTTP